MCALVVEGKHQAGLQRGIVFQYLLAHKVHETPLAGGRILNG